MGKLNDINAFDARGKRQNRQGLFPNVTSIELPKNRTVFLSLESLLVGVVLFCLCSIFRRLKRQNNSSFTKEKLEKPLDRQKTHKSEALL
jgi:hypothetical protein